MKKIQKRCLSLLLILCMLVSILDLTAIPAAAATSIPSGTEGADGFTYINLTEDIDLSSRWVVKSDTYLNLNGHNIDRHLTKKSKDGEVIKVANGATLIIADNSTTDVTKQGKITGGWSDTHAGGVHIEKGTVVMRGGQICNNKAGTNGAAVNAADKDNSEFTLEGGYVHDNEAGIYGGAFYAYGSVIIKGGIIEGNTAGYQGGAIYGAYGGYFTSYTPVVVSGGTFRNNSAWMGGAIFIEDGKADIQNAAFVGNSADYGGAIFCNDKDGTIITDCEFVANTAKKGSAISINADNVVLSGLTVENNEATTSGGGAIFSNYEFSLHGKMIVRNNIGKNLVLGSNKKGVLKAALLKGSDVYVYATEVANDSSKYNKEEGSYNVIKFSDTSYGNGSLPYVHSDHSEFMTIADNSAIRLYYTGEDDTGDTDTPTTYIVDGKSYAIQTGTFKTPSHNDMNADLEEVYFYSDGYFMQDAKIYNEHLSTMSICLAMAGFNSNLGTWSGNTKAQNIIDLYDELGFRDIEINEGYKVKPTRNTIGIALAHRILPDGTVLLPIELRGTNYDAEWASNTTVGTSGESEGFLDATNQTMDMVAQYLEKHDLDANNVKFWVTGYSRTGAVSNMVAKKVIDAYNPTGERVYAYCHSPANGGLESELKAGSDYSGIHNTINPCDVVPYVPFAQMGFIRYGTDHYVPGDAAAGDIVAKNDSNDPGLYKDNNVWRTTSSAYKTQKAKMLQQLTVVEPDIIFDDNFSRATIDYVPTPGVNKRTSKLYSKWYQEDYVKNVISFTNDSLLGGSNTRETYATDAVFFKTQTLNQSLQDALADLMELWRADLNQQDFEAIAANITDFTDYISFSDKAWFYDDVIWNYSSLPSASQQSYAKQYFQIVKDQVLVPGLADNPNKDQLIAKIEGVWGQLADSGFRFLNTDYRKHNNDYAGTLIYNLARIGNAHTPVVNYAWLRSYDSFYNSVPQPDGSAEIKAPATPTVSLEDGTYDEEQTLIIECATPSADIYYSLNGSEATLYTGPITLAGKPGKSVDYDLTTYAQKPLDKASSEMVVGTYTIELPAEKHSVTVNDGTPTDYAVGSTVTLTADVADDQLFKSWKATNADGDEIGSDKLVGFNADHKSIIFTMPDFDVKLETQTVSRINQVAIELDEDSITDGSTTLPTNAKWWIKTDDIDEDNPQGTASVLFSVAEAGSNRLTANITISADEANEIAFTEEVAVWINGEKATAKRNTDGSITVQKTYDVSKANLHTVRINLKNANGSDMIIDGQTKDYVLATYTAGDEVELTAPATPINHVFSEWSKLEGIETESDLTDATITFTMPDEDVEITAIYLPIIHKAVLTLEQPVTGQTLPTQIEDCVVTITDDWKVPTNLFTVSYPDADSLIAASGTAYTAVVSVSSEQAASLRNRFTLGSDIEVVAKVGDQEIQGNVVIDRSNPDNVVVKAYIPLPETEVSDALTDVLDPGTITVPYGTSADDIFAELPKKITGLYQSGSEESNVPVTWQKRDLNSYDASEKDGQTLNVSGFASIAGLDVSDDFDDQTQFKTIHIAVESYQTEYKSHEAIKPTGSIAYGGNPLSVLPETVQVTGEDGYEGTASITWNDPEYVLNKNGGSIEVTGTINLPQYFVCTGTPDEQAEKLTVKATVNMDAMTTYAYTGYEVVDINLPYMEDVSNLDKTRLPSNATLLTDDSTYSPSAKIIWNDVDNPTMKKVEVTDDEGNTKEYYQFTITGVIDADTIPEDITGITGPIEVTADAYMEVEEETPEVKSVPLVVDATANGYIEVFGADGTEYVSGEEVNVGDKLTIKAIALPRYTSDKITVNGNTIKNGATYTVADTDTEVHVQATFKTASSGGGGGGGGGALIKHDINLPDIDHGTVTADKDSATSGATVTITVTPDKGYELDQITVTDEDGNEIEATIDGNKITFKMPNSAVDVEASFKQSDEIDEDGLPFKDVSSKDWFYDDVRYVYEEGLMSGMSADLFGPGIDTTRGMIVTILYRMEGEPAVDTLDSFDDVAPDQYYAKAVSWGAKNKIVSGYGDGNFGPNDTITREQMAAILYRYANYKGYDTSVGEDTNILSYTDFDKISSYAIPALQWTVGEGIIAGTSDDTLSPTGKATRAQVAAILHRFCENVE